MLPEEVGIQCPTRGVRTKDGAAVQKRGSLTLGNDKTRAPAKATS